MQGLGTNPLVSIGLQHQNPWRSLKLISMQPSERDKLTGLAHAQNASMCEIATRLSGDFVDYDRRLCPVSASLVAGLWIIEVALAISTLGVTAVKTGLWLQNSARTTSRSHRALAVPCTAAFAFMTCMATLATYKLVGAQSGVGQSAAQSLSFSGASSTFGLVALVFVWGWVKAAAVASNVSVRSAAALMRSVRRAFGVAHGMNVISASFPLLMTAGRTTPSYWQVCALMT